MLVMVTEGGETKHSTNINFLLEEFGIMANSGERGGEGGREEGRGEGRISTLIHCPLQQMWSRGLPTTNTFTQRRHSSPTEC